MDTIDLFPAKDVTQQTTDPRWDDGLVGMATSRVLAPISVLLYWAFLVSLPFLLMAAPMLAHAEAAHRVTIKDVEDAIAGTLRDEGAGDKLKVSVQASGVRSPIAEYDHDIKMYVDKFELQKDQQRFDAMITFEADGRALSPIKVMGRYEGLQSVPVLIRSVTHGQTIAAEDITTQETPLSRIRKGTATESDQLIGQTPVRTISPNRAVRLDELVPPSVIAKGNAVTLIFKANHLEIRGLGEALDNGAIGDLIRVKNRDSKQVVQGTVTDAHTVTILSSSTAPSGASTATPAKAAEPAPLAPLHAEKRYGSPNDIPPSPAPPAILVPERTAPATQPAALEQELQSNNGKAAVAALPVKLPAVIPDTPAPKTKPEDLEK